MNTVGDINADCSTSGEYEPNAINGAWTWEIDLNGDCVTTGSYDLYWKAGQIFQGTRISSKILLGNANMYQLGTVPLSCNLGQIEVDSEAVTLTEKNIAGVSESISNAIRIV